MKGENLSQKLNVNFDSVGSNLELLPNYHSIVRSTVVLNSETIVELNDSYSEPFIGTSNKEEIKIAVKSVMSEDTSLSIVNSLATVFENFTPMEESYAKKLARLLQEIYKKFSYDAVDMEMSNDSTRFVFLNLSKY